MINLIAVLVAGIPAIISATLAFFARKMATAAGSVVALIALTVTFIACERGFYDSLIGSLILPEWFANALGLFVPSNFTFCLSAYVSSKICAAAYRIARQKIELINGAS